MHSALHEIAFDQVAPARQDIFAGKLHTILQRLKLLRFALHFLISSAACRNQIYFFFGEATPRPRCSWMWRPVVAFVNELAENGIKPGSPNTDLAIKPSTT